MPTQPNSFHRTRLFLGIPVIVAIAAAAVFWLGAGDRSSPRSARDGTGVVRPVAFQPLLADPLDGGVDWINTSGPIRLRDLRGKIVLLDFWTFCCINCHHVLPDLAKLEEKYKGQLVVIGVHTPKFIAERDTNNVRQKVREYGIKHPVVNDSDQIIWNRLGIESWPTLLLLDPDGKPIGSVSGEGHYAILDEAISKLVEQFRGKGLNEAPLKFFAENEKPDASPLLYPGKILADATGNRLFIADTGHNRVVITDLQGKKPTLIGSGSTGMADGPFDKAEFHRPQGMTLLGDTLYVADTENHAIRAVDLKKKTVATVAGTGEIARTIARTHVAGVARKTPLSSPWDLTHAEGSRILYVAMAGPHQIWRFDAEAGQIGPWAGTGVENILDGPIVSANFAQPSGLATDGTHLFVADSEVSAVRELTLGGGKHLVRTIVGEGLFEFGDEDGQGPAVRLQHCLGVAYGDGKLFIADTYNNKIKICDPRTRSVTTFVGAGPRGDKNSPAEFYQPGGLSVAARTLFVADTNNHKIRVVDIPSKTVSTLDIGDLNPPKLRARKPTFPNATRIDVPKTEIGPGRELTVSVTLPIPPGYHLNAEEGSSMAVVVETPGKTGLIDASKLPESGTKIDPPAKTFTVKVPFANSVSPGDSFDLKVSVLSLICSEGSKLCMIKSYVWNVPVTVTRDGESSITLTNQ